MSCYSSATKEFGSSTNWLFLPDLPCRKTCTRSSYLPRLEFPEISLKASHSLALFEIHFHSDEGNGKCNTKRTSLQFRWFSICFSGRLSRWAHPSTHNDRTAALEHCWNIIMKKCYKENAYNHLKLWYNVYGNGSLQYSRAFFPLFAVVWALFQLSEYCFEWRLLLLPVNECINNFWSSGVKLNWLNVITAVGAYFRFSVRTYFLMTI